MSENNDTNKKIDDLAAAVARGFEEVHEKFAAVDKRFDQVESRFDHLDRRMDEFADHERRITRLEEKLGASEV